MNFFTSKVSFFRKILWSEANVEDLVSGFECSVLRCFLLRSSASNFCFFF